MLNFIILAWILGQIWAGIVNSSLNLKTLFDTCFQVAFICFSFSLIHPLLLRCTGYMQQNKSKPNSVLIKFSFSHYSSRQTAASARPHSKFNHLAEVAVVVVAVAGFPVSLADDDQQFTPIAQAQRQFTWCAHPGHSHAHPTIIPDARSDSRFRFRIWFPFPGAFSTTARVLVWFSRCCEATAFKYT